LLPADHASLFFWQEKSSSSLSGDKKHKEKIEKLKVKFSADMPRQVVQPPRVNPSLKLSRRRVGTASNICATVQSSTYWRSSCIALWSPLRWHRPFSCFRSVV